MDLTEGVMQVGDVECRFTPPQALLVTKELKYVDIYGLLPLISKLNFIIHQGAAPEWDPPNLVLNGPTGVGKSLFAAFMAQQHRIPYLTIDCSEETRERQFKGGFVVKDGNTPYVLGTAANAIHVANEVGAAILVLEEINALSSQQQKVVNAITDFRKKVEIPEISLRLELRKGAKLWVIGTANPSAYGGVFDMNPDLKSRFIELEVPYPPPAKEKQLLREMAPEGVTFDDQALDSLVNIARETRQGSTAYQLSPRDLVEAVRVLPRLGWEDTLFLLTQKFSQDDRKLVRDRIQAITRITLDEDLNGHRG